MLIARFGLLVMGYSGGPTDQVRAEGGTGISCDIESPMNDAQCVGFDSAYGSGLLPKLDQSGMSHIKKGVSGSLVVEPEPAIMVVTVLSTISEQNRNTKISILKDIVYKHYIL